MGEEMVKAIMFDFWGTVVENGIFPSPVRQARLILNIDRLPFPLFILEFEKSLMTKRFDDLYKAFEGVCDEFKLKPESIGALEELRKKYKLILVSNTDSISVDSVLEKYGLKKHFDSIYLSCDMGMLKSNPKMFEAILKKEGLTKDDVIMVGDSIESDLIPAEKVGIRGFLIDRNNKREHPSKILTLSEIAAKI
jgi:HAD superfamily hydrolase (TIGR01549 family)